MKCICPLCFTMYPPKYMKTADHECPACMSEAIGIPLEPLDAFLRDNSLAELRDLLKRWKAAKGFIESYKQEKAKRIESVIAMKEKGGP